MKSPMMLFFVLTTWLLTACSVGEGPSKADIQKAMNADMNPEEGLYYDNVRLIDLERTAGGDYLAHIKYDLKFTKSLKQIMADAKASGEFNEFQVMMGGMALGMINMLYGGIEAGDIIPAEDEIFLTKRSGQWVWE